MGRWQQVDKPAITMTFLKEGTFSASVAGQRILGGKYRLVNGEQLVLDCDAASLKVGPLTNRAFMAGEKLVIVSADGNTESYHRAAQPSE